MKVRINYHSINHGAHILSSPDFTHSEIVEVDSLNDKKLVEYIESKTDDYGNHFKLKDEEFMGFQYFSSQGGVIVEEYNEPKVKIL